MAGRKDQGLTPTEISDLITNAIGRPPREYAHRTLKGDAGRYEYGYDKLGNQVNREVRINRELAPDQKVLVLPHETGHMAEDLVAGPSGMSIEGLEDELKDVHSTLRTGIEGLRPPKVPQDFGYSESAAPSELVAEGFRAYLTNPNYFKEVAPKSAAAFRAFFNSHPWLSKWIQLNGFGGLAVLGGANGSTPDDKSGR
jgi:hypothetical protein